MNRLKYIISTFVILLFTAQIANSQCAKIVASPASASCNVSYNFNVTGNLFGTTFDFNSGQLPSGWKASPYQVARPCNSNMIDNSPYFWATTLSSANVRFVQTTPLNVSNGGAIEFYMRYGSDDPSYGCEDPDLTSEGVFLQFSTNNGASWANISTWTPRPDKSGPLYRWTKYSYNIPAAARTSSTLFRWYQPSNSGPTWDNWGLDNIEVSALSASAFAWDFGDGNTSTAQNPSHTYSAPGTYTVTLTVTSPNCNTTTTTQVTVAPGPSLSASLTHPSCPSAQDGEIDLTFNNAKAPISYSWTPVQGNTNNPSGLGEGVYEVIVTDGNNCNANATYELKSQGNVAPVALAKNVAVELAANGTVSVTPQMVDNGSYSDCGGIATMSLSQTSFDCSNVGDNTVTLTIEDVNGNTASASAVITVSDKIVPVVDVKDATLFLNNKGTATLSAAQINNGSADACGIASIVVSKTDFDCSNVGTLPVTLTVTDVNGNSDAETAMVTIIDNITPSVWAKDIIVELNAQGVATITATDIDAGTSDACGIASLSIDVTDFDCSSIGENIVTLTAVDANGNSASKTAIVTVEDNIAPAVVAKDITVSLDDQGEASISAADIDAGTADACGIASLNVTPSLFSCAEVGANVVTFVVTDVNGNTSSVDATVTVIDAVAPVAVAKDITVYLNADGQARISASDIDAGSNDACGIESLNVNITDFDCATVGDNTVELTVTDVNANASTVSSVVTVVDAVAPVVTCPADISVISLRDDCDPQIEWAEPTVVEACDYTVSSTFASGDEFPVGVTPVEYTVVDASANTATCAFTVTVTPEPLVATISAVSEYAGGFNISCFGANDGSATVTVEGGCLPYSFLWSDGQTVAVAENLVAGDYTVVITDANGTITEAVVTLTEPTLLESGLTSPTVISSFNTSCDVTGDGSVNLTAQGGVAPYAVVWNTGDQDVYTLNNLLAGDYTAVVTDANGCETVSTLELTRPDDCNCYPELPAPSVTCDDCDEVIDGKHWYNINNKIACIKSNYSSGVNFNNGTLVICGDVNLQQLNLNNNDKVVVFGTLTIRGLNMNGPNAVFENFGTVIVNGWSNINGTVANNGTMTINQGMNINQQGRIINNRDMVIASNMNLNGSIVNNGYLSIPRGVNGNSNADLINNCTFEIGRISINTTRTFQNNGTFISDNSLTLNNTKSYFGAGSITKAVNFTANNAKMNNFSSDCSLIEISSRTTLNGGLMNGPISLCDLNGVENNNHATLSNGANFSCDGCKYTPAPVLKAYSVAESTPDAEELLAETNKALAVYPVPVKLNGTITVEFESNSYEIIITNVAGSTVYTKQVTEQVIEVPANILSVGNFIVTVVDNDGKQYSKTVIVE